MLFQLLISYKSNGTLTPSTSHYNSILELNTTPQIGFIYLLQYVQ